MAAGTIDRRSFVLAGATAAIAAPLLGEGSVADSQTRSTLPRIVDVHTHMIPDFLVEAATAAGQELVDVRGWPKWSERDALGVMDRIGVGTSIISTPLSLNVGSPEATLTLIRRINDFAAKLKSERPDRFGFLATVPLPDMDMAIAEVIRCFDEIHADGVVLLSNSAGIYPGDPELDPLFAELDRRSAVLFIHPDAPTCPACSGPHFAMGVPVLEYMFESTRVVANLIASRALDRFANIKFIIPHGGAAVPGLADRMAMAGPILTPSARFTSQNVYGTSGAYTMTLPEYPWHGSYLH